MDNEIMEYRGYKILVKYDENAGIFYGEIIDSPHLIHSRGETRKELEKSFHEGVDEYLECLENIENEKDDESWMEEYTKSNPVNFWDEAEGLFDERKIKSFSQKYLGAILENEINTEDILESALEDKLYGK
jgi:predicted RNase H-like HicB family nuclease